MRAWARACSTGATPAQVFRRLADRAHAAGRPPPAALVGAWYGAEAVLAPSVQLHPVRRAAGVRAAADQLALDRPAPAVDRAAVPPDAVCGGWLGYLGYGLTDPGAHSSVGTRRRLPMAAGGWTDHVLRCDSAGRWYVEALLEPGAPPPLDLADELAALIAAATTDPCWPPPPAAGAARWPGRDGYDAVVRACLAAIADGEIYQANVCVRIELPPVAAPAELFAAGIEELSCDRAAFLAGPWGAVVSFSPELFLASRDRAVRSSPIKGTRPLSAAPAELLASGKDRAENIMITDMVRNDLGRVAVPGSVRVPELLAVHSAPGVWHLVSTVTATLRPEVTDTGLLDATFPPASVTGTPKLRALELLASWEDAPREVYCGAVGMCSPLAGLELSVAIRTVEVAPDSTAWLGVGGGITIDSDPAAEWQECHDKAAPLLGLTTRPSGVAAER